MRYSVNISGFNDTELTVEMPGVFSNPRLLVNGKPAASGQKKGEFLLVKDDGKVVTVKFGAAFLDAVPKLIVDGETFQVAEPLPWYQWAWSGAPIILVFLGGCIGGAIGGAAIVFNTRILRSVMPRSAQYFVTGLVSGATVLLYLIAVAVLQQMLPGK
jgi:hypothetical protein